jgi:putative addiction module killer protein
MPIKYTIQKTSQFNAWFSQQNAKEQLLIDARLLRIENEGHFGDYHSMEDGLYELRWANGRRIYYVRTGNTIILLLIGGNKNGQTKDVRKAKKLLP